MGYIVIWVGLVVVLIGIFLVFFLLLVGCYVNYFDLCMFVGLLFLVMVIICFMCVNFIIEVDYQYIVIVQLIMGFGVVFFFMLILSILFFDLFFDQIVDGFGLVIFLCIFGGSFVVLLIIWIWNCCVIQYYVYFSENISFYDLVIYEIFVQFGGNIQVNVVLFDWMVQSQVYMMFIIDYFIMFGWLFFVLLVIIWLVCLLFGVKFGVVVFGY